MDGLMNTDKNAAKDPLPSEWCVRWQPSPSARLRLFCVPHAGGGTIPYRSWALQLSPTIEVITIRLPGREFRHQEPPFTSIDDIMPVLMREVTPWLDLPHAWFGHSLGALISFEACRALRRLSLPQPVRLLVSGRPAPHLAARFPPIHAAPDSRLLERIKEMGGTPPEILNDTAMLYSLLPTLRADLKAAETYKCQPDPPLACPISVFGAASDRFAIADELYAWEKHSSAECEVRILPGGHFFLHEQLQQMLDAITGDLLPHSRQAP
jgi:surfactin synthase thioesterase subunit